MKFVVPSKSLYTVTSAVGKVISSKNALQILNNFLLSIEGDQLTITGSDVENCLSATIQVTDVEGSGVFCLDARRIVELLKEIPDAPLMVTINDDNYEVNIEYSGGNYQMVALPGDQYPQYKKEQSDEEPVNFTCKCSTVFNGIGHTLFAVGTDDFHPQMMGILLDIHKEDITFVATDTRKLVRYIDCASKPGVDKRCIMPAKPAGILKGILTEEGEMQVELTSKSATFAFDQYIFNCRFIKGNYPDYNRVIPKNNPYTLRVDRMRFLSAVRRVGVFVDPGYGMEKFKITTDKVYIKSSDSNMQSAGNEQLDCEYSGPDIVIGFSAPYMVEICNNISTEDIIIRLADPSRPGVFCPTENKADTDLLMLLMPMNVVEF